MELEETYKNGEYEDTSGLISTLTKNGWVSNPTFALLPCLKGGKNEIKKDGPFMAPPPRGMSYPIGEKLERNGKN